MNESQDKPVLFEVLPDLGENSAWTKLGDVPTPVQQLKHLGHDNLWIKRDDLISSVYGGNKVRKLEFVLADVIRQKKARVVTIGGIGTNHGLATAIFCSRLGLECTLILFYQPLTRYVLQNLRLYHKYGAEMIYAKNLAGIVVRFHFTQRLLKRNSYFLYAGGSSPVGTLGFVNAAFELKRQVDEGLMPEPKYIFCALGSNGTMAGLSLGALLAGLDTTVIGVRVGFARLGPMELTTENAVMNLIQKTYNLLRKNSSSIPDVQIKRPVILDEYFGKGYGYPTEECKAAMELFREREGIRLEPTYTAKACAALLEFIKDPCLSKHAIIYWHTYNSVDLSKDADSVDHRDLPKEFHQFFEKEPLL